MYTVLAILHVFLCLFLILVVLLQTGRGSDIGAVFGGGASQALFGGAGPGTFLGKLTAVVAAIFMITSLAMAGGLFKKAPKAVVGEQPVRPAQEAPAQVPQGGAAPVVPDQAPQRP